MMSLITPDPARFPILARHCGGLGPPEMRKPETVEVSGFQSPATNGTSDFSYHIGVPAATMGVQHV